MLTNMRWKVLLCTALCILPLSLSMPSNGYAGAKEEPNLTTERLFGNIQGLLTFEFVANDPDDGFGEVFVAFAGRCKNADAAAPDTRIEVAITVGPIPDIERAAFEEMTRIGDNGLRYFRLEGGAPAGCLNLPAGATIIITEVDKFINAARVIGAEVVVRGIGLRE